MPKLPPDINDYLEQINDNKPITTEGLEELVYKIVVHTGLSYDAADIIVKAYLNYIRNSMLRGDILYIGKIGKLFIQCPKNGTGKKKIFPTIKPYLKLLKKIKYE
jgi:nucleoid DNA-binding protein